MEFCKCLFREEFFKLGDAGGFIFNGYLTQTEPIFESRAV
jgi:hypothetical protein